MYKFWIKKNCSFVPKNVHLSRKTKTFVLFTLKMKFLKKKITKMYKFWIKKNCSFVPKNVHLSRKTKTFVLFTLKMKFLPKNFNKMYKFWIKTVDLYPKMYIWF